MGVRVAPIPLLRHNNVGTSMSIAKNQIAAYQDYYEMYSLYLDYMDEHHKGERLCREDSIVWASKQGLISDNEAALFYSIL